VLADATTVLRTLGNDGAHLNKDKVTVPMTWGMRELFRAVVEYVYVAPSRISEFNKSVEKGEASAAEEPSTKADN
jgi:hypothetical protein